MFDQSEATARWARARRMMADHDLDAVLAVDAARDEILHGNQRWLTGFIARGGPAAALLHRDGHIELIAERVGKTLNDYYQALAFPIELVGGYSPSLIAERVARLGPTRIGIDDADSFPSRIAAALSELPGPPELVDVSKELQSLRLRKSAYEIELVRTSCAIADAVWEHMAEMFRAGRRNYEVVADIDHLARLQGAEGGFHVIFELPFTGRPLPLMVDDALIKAGSRYLVEVSPRYEGYYSQLTIPVTSHATDEKVIRAHQDIVEVKQAAQPYMRPGADLSNVAKLVADLLAERGHEMTSLSLGHFCGMALSEPRHSPASPFILDDGMTLIFHPVLADAEISSLMRADTYLITRSGAEKLNRHGGETLIFS